MYTYLAGYLNSNTKMNINGNCENDPNAQARIRMKNGNWEVFRLTRIEPDHYYCDSGVIADKFQCHVRDLHENCCWKIDRSEDNYEVFSKLLDKFSS